MLRQFMWIACGALLGFSSAEVVAADTSIDLKNHRPRFHWKTGPDGRQSIYDGEMLVADFYPGPKGPKAMHGIGRPISLHNLRLIPGGQLAIANGEGCGPLCLSWRKHLIFYMKIDELSIDEKDPERLKLYVKSHDVGLRNDRPYQAAYQPNNVVEESWLELTYDPNLPSYVFDVRTKMTVQPGREQKMISRDLRGLEPGDILPANCNVPRDRKQFHYYVYKGRDGIYYKLPQVIHRGAEKRHIFYASGGTFAFLLEPHHNPLVELVGATGLNVFSEICWAMYDVHFKFSKEKELELLGAGKPLEAHFRFYSISEEAGRKMLDQAVWDPKLQLPGARRPPLGVNANSDFEPSATSLHPAGPFSSTAAGAECRWDCATGYQSKASLSISRQAKDGCASWQAWLDPLFVPELRAQTRYRVTAMIRTEGVTGGAQLVWQAGKDHRASRSLSGTTDWTSVTLEIGPVAGPATLKLIQQGAGQTWFDDVEVTRDPRAKQ